MKQDEFEATVKQILEQKRHEALGGHKGPARGQIWVVNPTLTYPDGRKVKVRPHRERAFGVLLAGMGDYKADDPHSIIRVFPVSAVWIFAGPQDLAFAAQNSPVRGVGLMIECWNPRRITKVNLLAPLGMLTAEMMDDIDYLWHCTVHNESADEQRLKSKGYIGPSIESRTDPRSKFRKAEVRRTQRTDFSFL